MGKNHRGRLLAIDELDLEQCAAREGGVVPVKAIGSARCERGDAGCSRFANLGRGLIFGDSGGGRRFAASPQANCREMCDRSDFLIEKRSC